jgi:uncharacterized membrane protein YdjX (TVP38/TMEM64 family)
MSTPKRPPGGRWRLVGGVLLVAAIALVLWLLPREQVVGGVLERARSAGPLGAFAVAALYVPGSVLLVPGTPITLATGATFGFLPTIVAIVIASNLGAQASFLVGRGLMRERVQAWSAASPRMRAVERAVGDDALRTVILLRLSPLLPFNLLNYALALSPVRFRAYALGTFLGMLPGNVVYCWAASALGDLARALAGDVAVGPLGSVLFVVGLVASVLVVLLIGRRARALLAERVREPGT